MFYSEKYQKWVQHVYVNGKRVGTVRGNSERETEKKAKKLKEKHEKKLNFKWAKAPVSDLIKLFVEENKDDWELSTYNWYQILLKHIEEPLGNMKLEDVTADDLNKALRDLSKRNPNTGYPASDDMLTHVASLMRRLFKLAYGKRFIEFDVSLAIKTPKAIEDEDKKERQGTRCLTLEEIGWIIYTPHELQTANLILLYTGMRTEELLALRWKDIDIAKGTITVNKAIKYDNDKPYLGSTKTGKTRVVIMPPDLLEHIKSVYPKKDFNGLVVCNSKGEYYSKSGWRSKYKSYLKDLDIKYGGGPFKSKCNPHYKMTIEGWSPYSLRHTSSTYGALFGVSRKQLADNQGHDPATMARFYEGELFELRKKEIEKVSFKNIAKKPQETT